jgi:MYXO-CTERM domain-containing protein
MYTTISPVEMTVDPMFHAQPGLPAVAANQVGTRQLGCNGEDQMVLPDGRQVALESSSWPAWDSFMPWVEKIEEYPIGGEKITLVDNSDQIDQQLALWNDKQGLVTGGAGGWGGNAGNGGNGGSGAGVNGASPAGGGNGCGCQMPGQSSGAGGLLALALGMVLALGRRRRGQR